VIGLARTSSRCMDKVYLLPKL